MIVQATNLPRVIACEGSLKIDKPDLPSLPPSESAQEGTAAHFLAAAVLESTIDDCNQWLGRPMPNGIFVTADMVDYVERALGGMSSRMFERDRLPKFFVETTTDFEILLANFAPVRIVGRSDFITWDWYNEVLTVDDFKFGFRLVEVEENWTLIAHAIGFVDRELIRPKLINFVIHQPRPYHPDGPDRVWSISADQLDEYRATLIKFFLDRAETLNTGPHCRDCAARITCPAYREAAMNAVDVSQSVAVSDDIGNDELANILDDIERAQEHLKTVADAYTNLAKHRIEHGQAIRDRALEMSYGHYRFNPTMTPSTVSMLSGFKVSAADLTKPAELITPAQAIKKGVPESVVRSPAVSTRPMIGVKLARVDIDKKARKLLG